TDAPIALANGPATASPDTRPTTLNHPAARPAAHRGAARMALRPTLPGPAAHCRPVRPARHRLLPGGLHLLARRRRASGHRREPERLEETQGPDGWGASADHGLRGGRCRR